MPATALESLGVLVVNAATDNFELDNGYIKVTVSSKTGGFGIRTLDGDKVNKSDNDRYLLFEYDEDNTSFTSFRVTRDGQVKEYIFGGNYPGSSDVSVSRSGEELIAVWSVDDLTFTQTISLVDTGSTEHGTALISYSVENAGQAADIQCRVLMDTALGYQDFAYYNVGRQFLQNETELGPDGYQKSFYAANNPYNEFIELRIDGAVVDPAGYSVDALTMTVSIKPAVLEKLEDGSYTVDLIYANGTACGSFRILTQSMTPPTGDRANIVLWTGVVFLSAIGLAVLLMGKRKKKSEEA